MCSTMLRSRGRGRRTDTTMNSDDERAPHIVVGAPSMVYFMVHSAKVWCKMDSHAPSHPIAHKTKE